MVSGRTALGAHTGYGRCLTVYADGDAEMDGVKVSKLAGIARAIQAYAMRHPCGAVEIASARTTSYHDHKGALDAVKESQQRAHARSWHPVSRCSSCSQTSAQKWSRMRR